MARPSKKQSTRTTSDERAERPARRPQPPARKKATRKKAARAKGPVPEGPTRLQRPRNNAQVSDALEEIADLLEIDDENPFRIRAYRVAAARVREHPESLAERIARGEDLRKLPGIGQDLAEKLLDLVSTGTTPLLGSLRERLPGQLRQLLSVWPLGPKRVAQLHQELGITTVEELRQACREGRVQELRGFGAKTEKNILESLQTWEERTGRHRLDVAARYADEIERLLRAVPGVSHVVVAGSYRRAKETVGDLDVLVTATEPERVTRAFLEMPGVADVAGSGPTRTTLHLESGLQVDLRVVAEESYGAALYYFTGSKAHNVVVRGLAQHAGLKINEYGVFRGEERVAGETEESVFAAVGLPYIEPELREDRGEIEAAQRGALPALVTLADLKGDLHAHTTASDGKNTIVEMARAAKERGLKYLALTDHSKRLRMVRGLDEKKLPGHIEAIRRADEEVPGITLLAGIEVDILEDGRLDLPEELLLELDVVVASVHEAFRLPREKQTERLLRALDHRSVTIFGHPSARIIGERAPIEVDFERIVRHLKERGAFLELDSQPSRLDLTDVDCRLAKDEGVLVSISSDAHSTSGFQNLRWGVGQARRGWLEKADVLNTRTPAQLRKLLAKARG